MKKYLIIPLVFIGIFTLISFLIPSEVDIQRSIKIKSTIVPVFHQIDMLKNWIHWSPWVEMDTTMEISYLGPDAGDGAKFLWKSNKLGNGNLLISSSHFPSSIKMELDFMGEGKSKIIFVLSEKDGQTKVIWDLTSDLGWNPINKYFGFIMKGMLGNDLDKGLTKLKQFCER